MSLESLFWKLLPGGVDGLKADEANTTFLWEILSGGHTWYHQQQQQHLQHTTGEEWLREFALVLHGVKIRRDEEGVIYDEDDTASVGESRGWQVVRRVEGLSIEDAAREARWLSPLSLERRGFVVCESHFKGRRLRLASPQYRVLKELPETPLDTTTHNKNTNSNNHTFNRRQMVDMVRIDDDVDKAEEWLRVKPLWRPVFEEVLREYKSACEILQKAFDAVKDLEDGKAFAKGVTQQPKGLSNSLYEMKRVNIFSLFSLLSLFLSLSLSLSLLSLSLSLSSLSLSHTHTQQIQLVGWLCICEGLFVPYAHQLGTSCDQ